jgi:hypothetical protein
MMMHPNTESCATEIWLGQGTNLLMLTPECKDSPIDFVKEEGLSLG